MRTSRTSILLLVLICLITASSYAQDTAARSDGWRFGIFSQGGSGLHARTDVQMLSIAGFRFGHVIGKPFGPTHLRTSFELNAEIIPYQRFYWNNSPVINGFAANPVILKWTFIGDGKQRDAPFILATGGLVVTGTNLPPGDTNTLNFTPGFGCGVHVFTTPSQAITADLRAIHISNATLGNHNPGVNASLQMSVGYTWFKR